MAEQIAVLSGHVSSGKTTLCESLAKHFKNVSVFKTGDYIKTLEPSVEASRRSMQKSGEILDEKTRGTWVREGLDKFMREHGLGDRSILVVDAVRIREQIVAIRKAYGSRVVHIHLDAPKGELERRYKSRKHKGIEEFKTYKEVLKNPTEKKVVELKKIADVVIDTKLCTEEDVMVKAASHLALYGREYLRLVDVLIGGQYGSEGKGHIASYLAREYDTLVRVGGPNAGHTVYSEPPIVFHHLPSGSLKAPDAKLLIGPGAVIYIPKLMEEVNKSWIGVDRLFIDPQAMVISEEDREKEKGLVQSMGSTGQGVGAAAARRILGRDPGKVKLARDIRELKPFLCESCKVLEEAFTNKERILLEGTQGTGLSLYHGNYPYVTSRDTTVAGCLAEAGISPSRTRKVIMVCRTYPIRVESPKGRTSGPMSQEISWAEVERRSKLSKGSLSRKERTSTTERRRRVGEFEWASLRKAASLNAPTDIALTFVDYISSENIKARRFEQLTRETIHFIEEVERVASAPVSLISTRFKHGNRSIIDRRAW